jgi:hypothetical protein
LQQTEWKEKGKKLKVLKQFNGMSTGQTAVDTLDFARRPSGSSIQSGSSDESASKKLKTTGTYPLNTTDFIPSNKVDVDKALLEKVKSEEVKAEKKRAKEAREAKNNEASEGMQKQIEEANLLGRESKEERKRAKEDAKEVERAEKEKAALEITKQEPRREPGGVLEQESLQVGGEISAKAAWLF